MTDAELAALEQRMIAAAPICSTMLMSRKRTATILTVATLMPSRIVTAMSMGVRMTRQQVTTRRALGGNRGYAALALSMVVRATTRSWPRKGRQP